MSSADDLKPFRDFRWLIADSDLLGGQLTVRGTRLSASLILACLAEGMSVEEIEETYGAFPHEALPEIMKAASPSGEWVISDRAAT
jgi:uncharacterized protein (DUF433 family)